MSVLLNEHFRMSTCVTKSLTLQSDRSNYKVLINFVIGVYSYNSKFDENSLISQNKKVNLLYFKFSTVPLSVRVETPQSHPKGFSLQEQNQVLFNVIGLPHLFLLNFHKVRFTLFTSKSLFISDNQFSFRRTRLQSKTLLFHIKMDYSCLYQ